MSKIFSLSTDTLFKLMIDFFEDYLLFEKICGIKRVGTRVLNKKGKAHQVTLFRVLDQKKLSYAKIKYGF